MSNAARNRTLIFIIVILLLANAAILTYFLWLKQPDKPAPPDRSKDRLAEALRIEVGFNDQQVNQYKLLKEAQWDNIKSKFDDLRKAKDNFFHLLSTDSVNDSILNNAADRIAERQKALDLQAFSHFKEIRKICKPEQQTKYDSLVQRMFHKITILMRTRPDSTSKK